MLHFCLYEVIKYSIDCLLQPNLNMHNDIYIVSIRNVSSQNKLTIDFTTTFGEVAANITMIQSVESYGPSNLQALEIQQLWKCGSASAA